MCLIGSQSFFLGFHSYAAEIGIILLQFKGANLLNLKWLYNILILHLFKALFIQKNSNQPRQINHLGRAYIIGYQNHPTKLDD